MPVRSSGSSVLRWPSAEQVEAALEGWAAAQRELHPELLRLGAFGSFARTLATETRWLSNCASDFSEGP